MRHTLLLFFFTLIYVVSTHAQQANPLLKLKHDKVIFCDFEWQGGKVITLFDSASRASKFITKQVELSAQMLNTLNTKLGDRKSFGAGTAACFTPHCGFVYFYRGKVAAQVLVCLECNRLQSSVDLPAQHQGKQGKGDDVYYIADGMSKLLRKYINQLLIQNKFSYQLTGDSSFDQ